MLGVNPKLPIETVNICELQFGIKNEMIKVSELISTKKKSEETKEFKLEYKPLFKFIYELFTTEKFNSANNDIETTIKNLNNVGLSMKCPIFMVEGGSVNMTNSFFNSTNSEVRESEIQKIYPDEIDELDNQI